MPEELRIHPRQHVFHHAKSNLIVLGACGYFGTGCAYPKKKGRLQPMRECPSLKQSPFPIRTKLEAEYRIRIAKAERHPDPKPLPALPRGWRSCPRALFVCGCNGRTNGRRSGKSAGGKS